MNSWLIVVLIGFVSTLEGEMIVQDKDSIKTQDMLLKRSRRNALSDPYFLWPNGQVYYIFDANIREFSTPIFNHLNTKNLLYSRARQILHKIRI